VRLEVGLESSRRRPVLRGRAQRHPALRPDRLADPRSIRLAVQAPVRRVLQGAWREVRPRHLVQCARLQVRFGRLRKALSPPHRSRRQSLLPQHRNQGRLRPLRRRLQRPHLEAGRRSSRQPDPLQATGRVRPRPFTALIVMRGVLRFPVEVEARPPLAPRTAAR
jgi:hypothetical protein